MAIRKKKKRNAVWVGVAIAICGILFIIHRAQPAISTELKALKLVPLPEHFTELYFENPVALPKHTVEGKAFPFAFTIHNLEGATTTYPYTVYFEFPLANPVTYKSEEVTLEGGASITINEAPIAAFTNEQVTVVVDLTSLNQQIDFLLPNDN